MNVAMIGLGYVGCPLLKRCLECNLTSIKRKAKRTTGYTRGYLFVDHGYDSDEIISTGYVLRKRIEKFNVLTTKLFKKTPSHRIRLKRFWRGIATHYVKRLSSFVAFVPWIGLSL